jgi:hypothetical protein
MLLKELFTTQGKFKLTDNSAHLNPEDEPPFRLRNEVEQRNAGQF